MIIKKHGIEVNYHTQTKLKVLRNDDILEQNDYDYGERINMINNLFVVDEHNDIGKMLPHDRGYSTIKVQVDVQADNQKMFHKELIYNAWRDILREGYEVNLKELIEEYNEWWDGYIYEADTKSEALKGWNANNGIGERIYGDMRYSFRMYLNNKYFNAIEEAERRARQWKYQREEEQRLKEEAERLKEAEERKSVFDLIDEIDETIEDEQTEEVEEVNV